MNRLIVFLIAVLWCIVGCKSSKNTVTPAQIKTFNNLIEFKEFTIESDFAYPQVTNAMSQVLNSQLLPPGNNAGAISLIGNANFLKMKGDSIFSYLPYYGERQMQVAYGGTDSAIQFNDLMHEIEVEEHNDNSKTISFSAKSNNENFKVYIRLFQNLTSHIALNSSSRFSIRYRGKATPLQKD